VKYCQTLLHQSVPPQYTVYKLTHISDIFTLFPHTTTVNNYMISVQSNGKCHLFNPRNLQLEEIDGFPDDCVPECILAEDFDVAAIYTITHSPLTKRAKKYNFNEDKWYDFITLPGELRDGIETVSYGGLIYLAVEKAQYASGSSFMSINLKTGKVEELPDLPQMSTITGLAVYDHNIYAKAYTYPDRVSHVFRYDILAQKWVSEGNDAVYSLTMALDYRHIWTRDAIFGCGANYASVFAFILDQTSEVAGYVINVLSNPAAEEGIVGLDMCSLTFPEINNTCLSEQTQI